MNLESEKYLINTINFNADFNASYDAPMQPYKVRILLYYYIFNKESVKPFVNNYTINIATFWIKTSITRNTFCIEIAISFVGEGNGNVFVNYAL